MQDYVLGVDGGKSKTVGIIADQQGEVIGWGRAGNSDKWTTPVDLAMDQVALCVQGAVEQAGIGIDQVSSGCFGLAGADWPEDFVELEIGLKERGLAKRLLIKNDIQIALRANSLDGVGLIISGGTHLAAAIRTPRGEEWFSAWSSVEGLGGARTGEKVIWAVIRAADGRGQPTILTEMVLSKTGIEDARALLRALSRDELDESFFASLTPLLFDAHYHHRDSVATDLILSMGADMSLWATGLLARFDLLDQDVPVILSGGLFKASDKLLVESLTMHVHTRAPRAIIKMARYEPVVGALFFAYDDLDMHVSKGMRAKIESSLPGKEVFQTLYT